MRPVVRKMFFSAFAVVSGLPCWKAFLTPSRGGVGDSSEETSSGGRVLSFFRDVKRPSAEAMRAASTVRDGETP